jgi:hypothetical protein
VSCSRALLSSSRAAVQIEPPVACRDCSSFDFHRTRPPRLGATLRGHQLVERGPPRETRLRVSPGMRHPLHRDQRPLDGVVGLVSEGAGHRHLRGGEHRIPGRLLLLEPTPDAFPVGHSGAGRHVAEPLTQRTPPHARALARPGPPGVARRAYGRTGGRRDRRQWLRPRGDGVAPAMAQTRSRAPRAQTLGGAVDALGEEPPDPRRRRMRARGALTRPHRTGSRRPHSPPRHRPQTRAPGPRPSWAATPWRGDRDGAWRRPGRRPVVVDRRGSARPPHAAVRTHR